MNQTTVIAINFLKKTHTGVLAVNQQETFFSSELQIYCCYHEFCYYCCPMSNFNSFSFLVLYAFIVFTCHILLAVGMHSYQGKKLLLLLLLLLHFLKQ